MAIKHTRKTIYDTIRRSGLLDSDEQKETAAAVFNEISGILQELSNGDVLELRGIGTFRGKFVRGRKFYNISTKQYEESADHMSVKFIPSKFVSKISNLDLQEQSDEIAPVKSRTVPTPARPSPSIVREPEITSKEPDNKTDEAEEAAELLDDEIEMLKTWARSNGEYTLKDIDNNFSGAKLKLARQLFTEEIMDIEFYKFKHQQQ